MEAETDIVLESDPEVVVTIRHGLPFSFAKRHGVLIQDLGETEGTAVYRPGASPLSLAEARRFAGVPLKLSRVSAEVFDTLLRETYEQEVTINRTDAERLGIVTGDNVEIWNDRGRVNDSKPSFESVQP